MTPERLQQIEDLFHSTLEQPPAERASFLRRACGADNSLHRSVQSLLAHHEQARSFIESPAVAIAASLFEDDKREFLVGHSIGHYEILELLGTGGMGEVYLAQDTTLGRKVALKVLPVLYTKDADRLRRFEQEARTASALNHPNIVTIYEIGRADSTHFIATEYLDGTTLRAHLATIQVRANEALDIALQVASALAAAHAKGVVHRDIKPENIMVLKDSYSLRHEKHVKVLDFGIAKLTETRSSETEAPTKPLVKTSQGVVLGTTNYMSPEQARGVEVDARTDIWSQGVVLYEMLTGNIPFEGETAEDVRAAILKDKLPTLSAEIPERLRWIVQKALRKDREERYQTERELFADLRELQEREIESDIMKERFIVPEAKSGAISDRTSGQAMAITAQEQAASTRDVAARSVSSAEYIVTKMKRHKAGSIVVLATLVIAMAGTAFLVYKSVGKTRSSVMPPFQTMRISKLTNTGKVADAAISPDGKYVVHVVDDGGRQSLWLRQVATSSNVQIVPPADVGYGGLTFSRDGNYIYYVKSENNTSVLYQMPLLGGAPRKLVVDIDSPVTFSPDGKQFAFVRGYPEQAEDALLVTDADGTEERKLAIRKGDDFFFKADEVGPAWSPDGKVIACPAGSNAADGSHMSVFGFLVEERVLKPFTSQQWFAVGRVAWLKDGNGLVVTAKEQASSPSQLWFLTYPGGEVHRITNDLNDYHSTSLTADSMALATVQSDVVSHIWVAPNGQASRASQVSSGKFDGLEEISWTPDNKIVYSSSAGGNSDIWIMDADGSNQKQLTANAGRNALPSVSPNGRYIVFISNRAGNPNIWRMDIDGSSPKQLTNGSGENCPHFTPAGDWVVYNSFPSKVVLWKVPIDGGNPVQLTDAPSWRPVVSPDGKMIACNYFVEHSGWKTVIIPFAGGQPTKIFDTYRDAFGWTPDGRALAYIDSRGLSNITSQPTNGSPSKHLTDFNDGRIFAFAWSHDGKQLALARGMASNDVVLIHGIRNQQ